MRTKTNETVDMSAFQSVIIATDFVRTSESSHTLGAKNSEIPTHETT